MAQQYNTFDEIPDIDRLIDVNNLEEGADPMGRLQILGNQIKDQTILASQIAVTSPLNGNVDLQTELNDLETSVSTALSSAESSGATAISVALSTAEAYTDTKVSTEVVNRNSALSTAISTEVIGRNNAVSSALSTAEVDIAAAVSTEVVNRNSAISTEVVNRNSAVSTALSTAEIDIASAVSTEVVNRNSADSTVLSTAEGYTDTKVSTEVVNRNTAVSTAISSEVINRDGAVSTALSIAEAYTDALAVGLNLHDPVDLASAGDEPLPACVAAGNRTGKTLTGNAPGLLHIDGVAVTQGMRVLIKDQVNRIDNGIYDVTETGGDTSVFVLTRSADYNGDPQGEVANGDFFLVRGGNTESDEQYVQVNPNPDIVDSSPLSFKLFSRVDKIIAGAGLKRTGNTVDIDITDISQAITTVDNSDLLVISEHTTNTIKKITVGNLVGTALSDTNSALSTAISTEIVNRNNAVSTALSTAEADLAAAISTEVIGRNNAVSTALSTAEAYTASAVSTEVVNRNSAISTEVVNRNSAISTAISTEVIGRDSAISVAISTEVVNRDSAVSAEVVNRNSAISSAISTEVVNRDSAVSTEVVNRNSAISTSLSTAEAFANTAASTALSNAENYTDDAIGNLPVREKEVFVATAGQSVFDLTYTPVAGSEDVFLNGLLQVAGSGNQYTLSVVAKEVTFAFELSAGETVIIKYGHIV